MSSVYLYQFSYSFLSLSLPPIPYKFVMSPSYLFLEQYQGVVLNLRFQHMIILSFLSNEPLELKIIILLTVYTVLTNFYQYIYDALSIDQINIQVHLIVQPRINPCQPAYSKLFGQFNVHATPLVSIGTKVMLFQPRANQTTCHIPINHGEM